ncbi:hypothetical protein ACFL6I_01815 [candidate division KSB1 bacterium]
MKNRLAEKSRAALYILCAATVLACAGFLTPDSDLYAQTEIRISPEEFNRIVTGFSETGGYFQTDNWVSNELTYLDVIESIEQNAGTGGVYIGVGPEQNYTYISAVRPDVAFIMDIRHLNKMQHLAYKILFEISDTRIEFLSHLFSIPVDMEQAPGRAANAGELFSFLSGKLTDEHMMNKTRDKVLDVLTDKYTFELTGRDSLTINYVFRNFRLYNMNITYRGARRSWYPTLRAVMTLSDDTGAYSNPFNSRGGYEYLREMHLENRIIPVTGDFGGTKALNMIGNFARSHGMTVTAYYVSNVEEYVFRNRALWVQWAENVMSLPITERSVFIRWTHERSGYYQQTRLQYIEAFIGNYRNSLYRMYSDLKTLDYIK